MTTKAHFYYYSTALLALLGVTAIQPFDMLTWFLEIFPILIALPVLWATYDNFRLTNLLYFLIFLHAVILMTGGHYTYARVPLGFWIQDWFDLSRNPYDRIGHLAQGFIPALIAREILLRKKILKPGAWLFIIVVTICMSISVLYEFIEWWTAVILGQGAEEFLGTQGDQWDTQWDMFLATVGAISGQLIFSRLQDRQITKVKF